MTSTTGAAAPPRSRRGREGAADMIRSLSIVLVLVGALWFFGQASPGDGHSVRAVDPTEQLKDFAHLNPGVPVPAGLPTGWTANSATYDGDVLRIGYVAGTQAYAEFAAGRGATFVSRQAGRTAVVGQVDVRGVPWQQVRSGSTQSLLRVVKGVTLVVGGVREKASLPQLEQLASSVR